MMLDSEKLNIQVNPHINRLIVSDVIVVRDGVAMVIGVLRFCDACFTRQKATL